MASGGGAGGDPIWSFVEGGDITIMLGISVRGLSSWVPGGAETDPPGSIPGCRKYPADLATGRTIGLAGAATLTVPPTGIPGGTVADPPDNITGCNVYPGGGGTDPGCGEVDRLNVDSGCNITLGGAFGPPPGEPGGTSSNCGLPGDPERTDCGGGASIGPGAVPGGGTTSTAGGATFGAVRGEGFGTRNVEWDGLVLMSGRVIPSAGAVEDSAPGTVAATTCVEDVAIGTRIDPG